MRLSQGVAASLRCVVPVLQGPWQRKKKRPELESLALQNKEKCKQTDKQAHASPPTLPPLCTRRPLKAEHEGGTTDGGQLCLLC